jgi:hypothetical protein
MRKIILILAFTGFLFQSFSQDCVFYCPIKEGTKTEVKHYNAKDKIESTDKQTILSKTTIGNNVAITVKSESYDDKDKLVGSRDLKFECKNGVFFFDMKNLIDPATMSAYKDMEVKLTATNLDMPSALTVGKTLANGNVQMAVSSQGMNIMTMTVNITNRKVDANEKITTPAGTFDCFKISYDVETKMMFKVQTKAIDWVAKEVGVVRSENYDSKGKLVGYNVLTSIK